MGEAGASGVKTCIFCGQDCADKPRVKDKQGRYVCKPCLEKRRRQGHADGAGTPGAAPAAGVGGPGGGDPVLAEMLAKPGGPSQDGYGTCTSCGTLMKPGAVVCLHCGFNNEKGKSLKTRVVKAKEPSKATKAAKATATALSPVFWLLGGTVGAAVGAGIWAVVALKAEAEVGWIAWGVGVLAGLGVSVASRGTYGTVSGVVAAICAVAGVFGGKAWAGWMVIREFTEADLVLARIDPTDFFDWFPYLLSPWDILWVVLAVASAYQLGSSATIEV